MNRFALLRKERNLTQAKVAEALNISRQLYHFYETGQRDPNTDTLCRLADFYDVTVDYLLGRNISSQAQEHKVNDSLINLIADMDPKVAGQVQQFANFLLSQANDKAKYA